MSGVLHKAVCNIPGIKRNRQLPAHLRGFQFSALTCTISIITYSTVNVAAVIVDSTSSLGVYYFCRRLCLSVCLSCFSFKLILLLFFFFVSRWNRAIFWPSFVWHSTKPFSSIFDLGPLTPKICMSVIESVIVCGS